jgi:hypothetical protein
MCEEMQDGVVVWLVVILSYTFALSRYYFRLFSILNNTGHNVPQHNDARGGCCNSSGDYLLALDVRAAEAVQYIRK